MRDKLTEKYAKRELKLARKADENCDLQSGYLHRAKGSRKVADSYMKHGSPGKAYSAYVQSAEAYQLAGELTKSERMLKLAEKSKEKGLQRTRDLSSLLEALRDLEEIDKKIALISGIVFFFIGLILVNLNITGFVISSYSIENDFIGAALFLLSIFSLYYSIKGKYKNLS